MRSRSPLRAWRGPVGALFDTAVVMRFRAAGLRGRQRRLAGAGLGVTLLVLVTAAWLPAVVPEGEVSRADIGALIPSLCLTIVLLATVAAATSGGGRQLLTADQSAPFPLGATADHFGALALAPLNIAWLLQATALLGVVSYGLGPTAALLQVQTVTVLWLFAATAIGQALAWTVEWVRRGPAGRAVVRTGTVVIGTVLAWLAWSGHLGHLLDRSSLTRWVLVAQIDALSGRWWGWTVRVGALLGLIAVAVTLGAVMAHRAAARMPRDQVRLESAYRRPRAMPRSDLVAMMRVDRASVWRSVPLRRGAITLGVLPGAVAVAGDMSWSSMALLPGLVCSGAALLFGINAWCLDGRGGLWRDSLPVDPAAVFTARVGVLLEILVASMLPTLVLAAIRAGRPTAAEAAAVLGAVVAIALFVTATCMRSSVATPYAADLGDARGVPAPPLAMLVHSARLAGSTTLLGLAFDATARATPLWSLLVALPIVLGSAYRIVRALALWQEPTTRARVLTTVAG